MTEHQNEYDDGERSLPESEHRRRGSFRGQWLVLGLAVGVVLALIVAIGITQTAPGRERILGITLQTLGGRLNGVLTIERLNGNLFTGAWIYNLELRDHDGEPLAIVDSAYIRYRLPTLLGGDIVITRLQAYSARINLFQMPGDTLWNYQDILTDPHPDPDAPPRATLVQRLIAEDAHVTIRAAWEPDPRLSPAEQEAEIRQVLEDPRWMIEPHPEGFIRTMLIDLAFADVSELHIAGDERGGVYLEVNEGSADVRLWQDPPLEVRSARARLHLQHGILNYQAPSIVLPNSRGESVGRIDLRGDRPLYDVVITSPVFALADLRFLYPWLPDDPEQGVGSARLWIEDLPDALGVLARDLRLRMPGTEITGEFGIVVNEGLRFVDVNLEADPLRVADVEQLFPVDLQIEGLVIGGAVIRGES
jgi:hypothetical protein